MKIEKICHVQITNSNQMPRVWRAAESAERAGFDVTIIGLGMSFEKNGVHYIGFPPSSTRFERVFSTSKRMIERAVSTGADIIQLHSPEQLLYVPYLRRKKKKIVFDSHEFYGMQIELKEYLPLILRKPISIAYKAFEKKICKKIDGVLYPCTVEGKNYFEDRALRSCKIENYSSPIQMPLRMSTPERAVIYAGSLTHERGITSLAEAIRLVDDCKLILCGSFDSESYKERIVSMSDQIEYRGVVSREELFDLYSRCAMGASLVLPVAQYDKIDNMSTKIYECMQCGLPLICSNLPFTVKANERYKFCICVDPHRPDKIAEAIRKLLDNPEEACRLGENGKRAVSLEYNWENEEKKLLEFYSIILHSI